MNYCKNSGSFIFIFSLISPFVNGQSQNTDTNFPKVLATVLLVVCAVIIAAVIAKIVDMICTKRKQKSDFSDSGLSDHTRNMIRKRLKDLKVKRRKKNRSRTLNFFKLWSSKTKSHKELKRQGSSASDKSVVINVVEAQGEKVMKENDNVRTVIETKPVKFHNKVANGVTDTKKAKKKEEYAPKPTAKSKETKENSTPSSPPSTSAKSSSSADTPKTPSSGRSAAAISLGFDLGNKKTKSVKFSDNVQVKTSQEVKIESEISIAKSSDVKKK